MVAVAGLVDGGNGLSSKSSTLLTVKNGEVVVGKMVTGVALGAKRRSEDDEVLRQRRMQNNKRALHNNNVSP